MKKEKNANNSSQTQVFLKSLSKTNHPKFPKLVLNKFELNSERIDECIATIENTSTEPERDFEFVNFEDLSSIF